MGICATKCHTCRDSDAKHRCPLNNIILFRSVLLSEFRENFACRSGTPLEHILIALFQSRIQLRLGQFAYIRDIGGRELELKRNTPL